MAGFTNDIMNADNVNFTGSNPTIGSITADGQLLIGNAVSPFIRPGVMASPNGTINFGYNAPDITADVSNSDVFPWTDQVGNFNAVAYNGYFVTALAVATLPASPSQGDTISFIADTASVLTITANTGQFIRVGSQISVLAGTCESSSIGDAITLVYRDSTSTWMAIPGTMGIWNLQTS